MFINPNWSRVVEQAVHFATSTGLCEVQGILPHLPIHAVTGLVENLPQLESRKLMKTVSQHETRQIATAAP